MVSWGRWGDNDERGALNRVDVEATRRGLAAVSNGEVFPLAIPIEAGRGPRHRLRPPPQHFMLRDGGDYAAGLTEPGFGMADDVLQIATHGTTHVDALAHIWRDHQMWNGYSASTVTSRGASKCSIDAMGPVVTRAIFADLTAVGAVAGDDRQWNVDELAQVVEATGVTPEPGDVLLLRTGWLERWRSGEATDLGWPGIGADCAEWIDDQGFAMVGADNIGVERAPTGDRRNEAPLHVALIRDRGITLIELMDLEELHRKRVTACLFVLAPLKIVGGVGSPVTPIAVI